MGEEYKIIKSSNGYDIFVDPEDFELLSKYSWHANIAFGRPTGCFRKTRTSEKNLTIHMHRFLMNPALDMVIDHINRNPLDNRKSNMRIVTKEENQRNKGIHRMGRPKASKFKGVSLDKKSGRWQARIVAHGKRINLGMFTSEEEAARAYDAGAKKHHGEFAYQNMDNCTDYKALYLDSIAKLKVAVEVIEDAMILMDDESLNYIEFTKLLEKIKAK